MKDITVVSFYVVIIKMSLCQFKFFVRYFAGQFWASFHSQRSTYKYGSNIFFKKENASYQSRKKKFFAQFSLVICHPTGRKKYLGGDKGEEKKNLGDPYFFINNSLCILWSRGTKYNQTNKTIKLFFIIFLAPATAFFVLFVRLGQCFHNWTHPAQRSTQNFTNN